mmetsp:Transcript_4107/g.8868  ORF Transcript_4107/g.8868 Transcript_4107/m.8868 type:complete len:81 (+) Transcript_4107:61-303(+)
MIISPRIRIRIRILIIFHCCTLTNTPFVMLILPFSVARENLPFTLSPEYLAAQRAYMRYHNMNPIFGISSKEARAADDAH